MESRSITGFETQVDHGGVEAIRLAVNVAQCDCVCRLHLCVCLLTDTGEKAGLQPFLYEQGQPF